MTPSGTLFDPPSDATSPRPAPSLDAIESTSPCNVTAVSADADKTRLSHNWHHTGWARTRDRVYRALIAARVRPSRISAFATCRSSAWLMRSTTDPDRYRWVLDCCHDRFCVPCAKARSLLIADNLRQHLRDVPHRFITLTLRTTDEPLATTIDNLLRHFQVLRRRRFWRKRVRGGTAFLETKYNAEAERWHTHLHVIAEGSYIPQHELADEWLSITGDSYIVDIRLARDSAKTIDYISKYATKTLDTTTTHRPERLQEAITALAGRKLLYSFGTWARWKLTATPDSDDWTLVEHYNYFLLGFCEDTRLAEAALAAYRDWTEGDASPEFRLPRPPPPPPHAALCDGRPF